MRTSSPSQCPSSYRRRSSLRQRLRELGLQEDVGDLPQGLLVRPSVHVPGAAVPKGDPEFGVADDDRVAGEVQKGGLFPSLVLSRPPAGDVLVDDDGPGDLVVGVADGQGRVEDELVRAVEAFDLDLLVDGCLALGHRPRGRPFLGLDPLSRVGPPGLVFPVLFGSDVAGAGPDLPPGRIALNDPSFLIGDPDADGQRFEDAPQQGFALPELLGPLPDPGLELIVGLRQRLLRPLAFGDVMPVDPEPAVLEKKNDLLIPFRTDGELPAYELLVCSFLKAEASFPIPESQSCFRPAAARPGSSFRAAGLR